MGTHPIFESDFDCLTDTVNTTKQRHVRLRDHLHEQARPDQGLGTREASHSQCSAYGNGRNVETHVWRCEQQNEHGASRKTSWPPKSAKSPKSSTSMSRARASPTTSS